MGLLDHDETRESAKTMNAPRTDAMCEPPMPDARQWYDHAQKIEDELEWLWANCRIVYFPPDGEYPIEHTMAARKDSRELIEAARDKWSNAPAVATAPKDSD